MLTGTAGGGLLPAAPSPRSSGSSRGRPQTLRSNHRYHHRRRLDQPLRPLAQIELPIEQRPPAPHDVSPTVASTRMQHCTCSGCRTGQMRMRALQLLPNNHPIVVFLLLFQSHCGERCDQHRIEPAAAASSIRTSANARTSRW